MLLRADNVFLALIPLLQSTDHTCVSRCTVLVHGVEISRDRVLTVVILSFTGRLARTDPILVEGGNEIVSLG